MLVPDSVTISMCKFEITIDVVRKMNVENKSSKDSEGDAVSNAASFVKRLLHFSQKSSSARTCGSFGPFFLLKGFTATLILMSDR